MSVQRASASRTLCICLYLAPNRVASYNSEIKLIVEYWGVLGWFKTLRLYINRMV